VAALEARLRAVEVEAALAWQAAAEAQAVCRTLQDQTARLSAIVERSARLDRRDELPSQPRAQQQREAGASGSPLSEKGGSDGSGRSQEEEDETSVDSRDAAPARTLQQLHGRQL
jgi:hypothetical protein